MTWLLAGVLAAASGAPAAAEERILSMESRVEVRPDSSLLVTETIRVSAEGDRIKRGIYRDFPTRYRDGRGHRRSVGFSVVEVRRDGAEEPHHLKGLSNGVRVYIGSKDRLLAPGEHRYELTYRTDRQLGHFEGRDELYWNATGNAWDFPIDQASAVVLLPAGASGKVLERAAYTGPQGAKGTDYEAGSDAEGAAVFRATRTLAPGEGLTVVVAWPPGFVSRPGTLDRAEAFLGDNAGVLVGGLGLLGVLGYYLFVWHLFGRDPEPGSVMPTYEPPRGLSPAAVRFVSRMGYDDKVFSAALVDLAVKGYLEIGEEGSTYRLVRNKGFSGVLSKDEAAASRILDGGGDIVLRQSEHRTVSRAVSALQEALSAQYERIYFITNLPYAIGGLLLSAVVAAGAFMAFAPGGMEDASVFLAIWLTLWGFGTIVLLQRVWRLWSAVLRGTAGILGAGQALVMTVFCLPFVGGAAFGSWALAKEGSLYPPALALTLALVNYLFYHWLKAPTLAGRRVMDQIDGFKMFIGATEKERWNTLYPAEKSPELFEKYLPYALALDLEHAWSEKFADVLLAAGHEGKKHQPSWYRGSRWHDMSAARFSSVLGGAMASAVAASATAPGSSSGGGGRGSSGGGGGGGGGGGW